MAEHATTVINRVNMLERAVDLSKTGRLDQAIAEFEAAYVRYFDVIKNHDYDLGARRGLASTTGFT